MAHQARTPPARSDFSPAVAGDVPQSLLDRAFAATSEISLITDAQQRILHASRSFTAITGYSEEEVLGRNCRLLQGPGTAPEAVADIRTALARGEKIQREILNYRKDGSPFWNALKVTPLLDETGRATHFVSVQRDINARMALHEQLRFQASHDPLTGLPNRAALDAHLLRVLEFDGGSRPAVAVGLIDLDGFKETNNALGHEAGDAVLKEWAARMQARLQPGEFLARLGGDEFVLVIEDAAEPVARDMLSTVLRRLAGSMEASFAAAGGHVALAMSAGLALSPRDGSEIRALLRNADDALRLAKARAGGTGWWHLRQDAGGKSAAVPGPAAQARAAQASVAQAPGNGADARALVRADESAGALYCKRLFDGGLEMFLQPVVDLQEGRVYLFEALARLRLEDGRYVSPAEFLPYLGPAETDRLFRRGLDQVLAQLAEWDESGLSAKASVNLAPSTLLHPDFLPHVEQALRRHTVAPERLVLELLETETIEGETLDGPLTRLVELGVGVAMDDLGAGYSSLKRLSTLPFTAVKIDREMLSGVRTSPLETLSLIATLVQLGRDFDMNVVAEGLEDLGMTEAVAVLGAQHGQGYHLARPMPASEVPGWAAEFESRIEPPRIRTALGALAYHWKFLRLGSPHPGGVLECPFSGYLDFRGSRREEVDRWHSQQHRAAGSSGASQMIVDWLIGEIRGGF